MPSASASARSLAERLLHGEVSARYVPLAALAMAFFAWDLHAASAGRPAVANLRAVSAFLARAGKLAHSRDLVGVAMAGGLFTVPLYAILQHESEPAHRARVIAANNIINALAMAIGAVGGRCLLARGLTMGELFGLCGLADYSRRAGGGVDPAADDGEEPRAIDPATPLPRARSKGSSTRARRCRRR